LLLFGSINLGFLLREKLAAVLIIPSSWGSKLAGHFNHQLGCIRKLHNHFTTPRRESPGLFTIFHEEVIEA
jgi:hypothetical protein